MHQVITMESESPTLYNIYAGDWKTIIPEKDEMLKGTKNGTRQLAHEKMA